MKKISCPHLLTVVYEKLSAGADNNRADRGIFFFTGPLLLVLTTIFEFMRGQFLSMMICGFFSIFWLSFGLLQLPTLELAASYSATGNAAEGAATPAYNAAIALYLVVLGFALLTFFIFTLKTNVVLAMIIGLAMVAIYILSAAYFKVSQGDYSLATRLQHVRNPICNIICFAIFQTNENATTGGRSYPLCGWDSWLVHDGRDNVV